MNRRAWLLIWGALASTAACATDRTIAVPAKVAASWGFLTNSTQVKASRTMGVGFWQRASGAKPGVGEVFVSAMEYQLPEAPSTRLRSATFQFSGTPSQCVGTEPVVIDVYAYVGDGKGDIADTSAGTKIAQLSADCTDHDAFSRPIDVTRIVRETTVASGIRYVGFNVRKANNRQGPGLFALAAGKLTVVIADEDLAHAHARPATPPVAAAPKPPAPSATVAAAPHAPAVAPAKASATTAGRTTQGAPQAAR